MRLLFFLILLMCTGCSQWDAITKDEAAKASLKAMKTAEYVRCGAPFVTYIKRFPDDSKLLEQVEWCREMVLSQ